jgi:hypothetical protein
MSSDMTSRKQLSPDTLVPALRGQDLLLQLIVEQGWQLSQAPAGCLQPLWLPMLLWLHFPSHHGFLAL